jgi:hypothetical protein
MALRPNVTSLTLSGTDLEVLGESADPQPTAIFVVVTQDAAVGAARLAIPGMAARAITGWEATLRGTTFKKGAAEVMGVEVRIDPFESTSWVQSLTID